jgi:hypothetical protein
MISIPPNIAQDEERLGGLALQFRGTRRDDERREIAQHYSQTVERLIQSGKWHEMPHPKTSSPTTGYTRPYSTTGRASRPTRSREENCLTTEIARFNGGGTARMELFGSATSAIATRRDRAIDGRPR